VEIQASVGITVRVLRDLEVTRSREGQIILGAAILDDILGLMILAVVGGIASAPDGAGPGPSGGALAGIVLRAVLFLGIAVVIGHFCSNWIVHLVTLTRHPETMLVLGLTLCFTMAYLAELVGLADIIGAFAAGLLLDPYGKGVRVREDQATLSELLHPPYRGSSCPSSSSSWEYK
jgi:Kef-type K+ transport system membrane component KefB